MCAEHFVYKHYKFAETRTIDQRRRGGGELLLRIRKCRQRKIGMERERENGDREGGREEYKLDAWECHEATNQ